MIAPSMPVVLAITADRRSEGPLSTGGRVRPPRPEVFVKEALLRAVRAVGAEPVLLPPHDGDAAAWAEAVIRFADGVILSGGAVDLHPSHYGQAVLGRLDRVDEGRAGLELALARLCLARDIPVLGVCGGMQTLAVAAGGSLIQDIGTQVTDALEHEQPTDPANPWHEVAVEPALQELFAAATLQVNSTHHQAVASPGALQIGGRAPDGVAEILWRPDRRFCVGVEWHPELLALRPTEAGAPDPLAIFRALIAAIQK